MGCAAETALLGEIHPTRRTRGAASVTVTYALQQEGQMLTLKIITLARLMHVACDYRKNVRKHPHPMKVLQALINAVVAGLFAAAEALIALDESRVARVWHRQRKA